MAAVATDDGKTVTSRGWYRIDPGKCLHPDVTGQPKQIFSFAEAVDNDNRAMKYKDKALNWGGATQLCTREAKFEINEQGDCGTRGLSVAGFAAVDMGAGGKTLRYVRLNMAFGDQLTASVPMPKKGQFFLRGTPGFREQCQQAKASVTCTIEPARLPAKPSRLPAVSMTPRPRPAL